MITSGEIKGLGELLKKHTFVIPDYQRGYEWEAGNISDFHNTLQGLVGSGATTFLGTLIIKRDFETAEKVEIVDGQQRITTVFMYLAVLRDLLDELTLKALPPAGLSPLGRNPSIVVNALLLDHKMTDYRLLPNDLIRDLFLNHVVASPRAEDGTPRKRMPKKDKAYTKDFRRAYALIRELLEREVANVAESEQEKLIIFDGFLEAISEQLQVLPIFSGDDSEALEIFMTMNTKGLRLAASDIIKSNIFKGVLSCASTEQRSVLSQHMGLLKV